MRYPNEPAERGMESVHLPAPAPAPVPAPDEAPVEGLFALVYTELRAYAAACLLHERPSHTLQPTALVHEAYLRLAAQRTNGWANRTEFFAVAAQAVRRVLVDSARRHNAAKRGGGRRRLTLHEVTLSDRACAPIDIVALDEAMTRLERLDGRHARVVELVVFGGLTQVEIAEHLDVSRSTVHSDWTAARAWLSKEIAGEDDGGS